LTFNLILQGLKCKIKRSEIYFNKKYDLSTYVKTKDFNVFLSLYPYPQDNPYFLQDNPYLQDNLYLQNNDNCLLSNSILIHTSKKRMSLIETLLFASDGTLAL